MNKRAPRMSACPCCEGITQHCSGCGRYLALMRFRLNKSEPTGLNKLCRSCHSRAQRAYMDRVLADPEKRSKFLANKRAWSRMSRRKKAIAHIRNAMSATSNRNLD